MLCQADGFDRMKAKTKRTEPGRVKEVAGKQGAGLPIYFNTGRGAMVILSLKPLRSCKFSHS